MTDKNFTRDSIRSWIKAKLGYPVVLVELTDDMLDVCIEDALEEVSPWVVQRQYVTLPVSECIDLSEYNVAYVINVHKANGANESTVDAIDVFSPYSYMEVRGSFQGITYNRIESMLYENMVQSTKDSI